MSRRGTRGSRLPPLAQGDAPLRVQPHPPRGEYPSRVGKVQNPGRAVSPDVTLAATARYLETCGIRPILESVAMAVATARPPDVLAFAARVLADEVAARDGNRHSLDVAPPRRQPPPAAAAPVGRDIPLSSSPPPSAGGSTDVGSAGPLPISHHPLDPLPVPGDAVDEAQVRARIRAEVEAQVRAEVKAEVEAKVKAEVEAKVKAEAEAEAKAKAEAEAQAKAEAEAQAKAEAEAKAQAQAHQEYAAAAKIQAVYRGYSTRKSQQQQQPLWDETDLGFLKSVIEESNARGKSPSQISDDYMFLLVCTVLESPKTALDDLVYPLESESAAAFLAPLLGRPEELPEFESKVKAAVAQDIKDREEAAARLQAIFRRKRERAAQVEAAKKKAAQAKAAVAIQNLLRGNAIRASLLSDQAQSEHDAAVVIQSALRGALARKAILDRDAELSADSLEPTDENDDPAAADADAADVDLDDAKSSSDVAPDVVPDAEPDAAPSKTIDPGFQSGDSVWAVYEGDGEEYPASVVWVDGSTQSAGVIFDGYDDEELVVFSNMRPRRRRKS